MVTTGSEAQIAQSIFLGYNNLTNVDLYERLNQNVDGMNVDLTNVNLKAACHPDERLD
jgi:hypothetical protein